LRTRKGAPKVVSTVDVGERSGYTFGLRELIMRKVMILAVVVAALTFTGGCASSKSLSPEMSKLLVSTCTVYEESREDAIEIREELKPILPQLSERSRTKLIEFDRNVLPKADAAGQMICAAAYILQFGDGAGASWLSKVPWEDVLPLALRLAGGI
jgi:hypothetical protein